MAKQVAIPLLAAIVTSAAIGVIVWRVVQRDIADARAAATGSDELSARIEQSRAALPVAEEPKPRWYCIALDQPNDTIVFTTCHRTPDECKRLGIGACIVTANAWCGYEEKDGLCYLSATRCNNIQASGNHAGKCVLRD